MANFGFVHLTVAAAFAPHWREARSAVGAPEVLQFAKEASTLADAIAPCSFVIGTGTLEHRKPEQPVVALPDLPALLRQRFAAGDRVALVLGPEKHGLTRQHLSYCHVLVEIPTDQQQPSMNLGQAAAVCLYEIATHTRADASNSGRLGTLKRSAATAPSAVLDQLGRLIEETMLAAHYSPDSMHNANRHDLRVLLRRLGPSSLDARRMLGLFRRILRRLREPAASR